MALRNYDPKLREAAEEFKSLCRKYDCVGVVMFVSPTNAEFVNHVDASWSVMRLEAPDRMRIRSTREDFDSPEAQFAANASSAHAVTCLMQWGQNTATVWSHVLRTLREHMTVLYRTWDGTPDSVPGDGK